jgi:hypothetical protein
MPLYLTFEGYQIYVEYEVIRLKSWEYNLSVKYLIIIYNSEIKRKDFEQRKRDKIEKYEWFWDDRKALNIRWGLK